VKSFMGKPIVAAVLAVMVAACSPPSQQPSQEAPRPPTAIACNAVHPDASKQVRVEEETATAAAASDLRGGRIAPGMYDLTSARRIGAATGWAATRAVALEVSEAASGGVTFNWAGAAPGGALDTWTANFTDTPRTHLSYTCGRSGDVDADYSATAAQLDLRLPDGANGALHLVFVRRGA
jgi:hypothetical protein